VKVWLVILGVALVVLGLAWPWIEKLGLGRLPGDFRFEREGFSFYFPLTTSIIVSIVVSLVIWLLRR
jgi:ribose/xylose/arabinose/galactoside ABC-type transport system permease subunit